MPSLHWLGKEKVINHHLDIPFHTLNEEYRFASNEGKQPDTANQGTDNKIIHADNLLALKSLLPEYEGRIKCIYIDPPYNTGNEGWVYNDNVSDPRFKKWLKAVVGKEGEDLTRHDKWLCMMYPRLVLLHKLLADDGAIFISIDDNEQSRLKMIMDEIFGIGNFVTNVIWEKNYSPRNDAKYFSASHDFIIVYSKTKSNWKLNLAPRTDKQNKYYKYDDKDGRGLWRPDNVLVKSFSESGVFGILNPNNNKEYYPPKGSCYRFNEEKSKEMLSENRFYFGKDGNGKPQLKRYLFEVNDGVVPQTIWKYDEVSHNQEGKKELNKIIEGNVFDSPKPFQLIERVLQIATDSNSIILDSFAGSGTTAHAVLNLNKQDGGNRKFILIEMEDYAETITAERVKRVINGYKDTEGTGGSFSFYTLGETVLDDEGNLNPNLALPKIHSYIWFAETRQPYTQQATAAGYLGQCNNTGIYFYYEPQQITVLDDAYLVHVTTPCEQYIMYADVCLLSDKTLRKHNIIFKKIPRDISKL
jgi:adenine-specific DNA-methyltransferase